MKFNNQTATASKTASTTASARAQTQKLVIELIILHKNIFGLSVCGL